MASLIDKFMGAVRGLRNDVQNKISTWATRNPDKAGALLTYEPLVKGITNPIQTAKDSLASQNIRTPKQFASTVLTRVDQNFPKYVDDVSSKYLGSKLGPVVAFPTSKIAYPYARNVIRSGVKTLVKLKDTGYNLGKGKFKQAGGDLLEAAGSGLSTAFRVSPYALPWLGYEAIKGGSAVKVRGGSFADQLRGAKQAFIGDKQTGFGTSQTTDPKMENFLNTAEGVAFLAYGIHQGWKYLKNWNDLRLKTNILKNTQYTKDMNVLSKYGLKEGDFTNKKLIKSQYKRISIKIFPTKSGQDHRPFAEFQSAFDRMMGNYYRGVPKTYTPAPAQPIVGQPQLPAVIPPVSVKPIVIPPPVQSPLIKVRPTTPTGGKGEPTKIDFTDKGIVKAGSGITDVSQVMVSLKNAVKELKNVGYSDSEIKDIMISLVNKVRKVLGKLSIREGDIKEAAFKYTFNKDSIITPTKNAGITSIQPTTPTGKGIPKEKINIDLTKVDPTEKIFYKDAMESINKGQTLDQYLEKYKVEKDFATPESIKNSIKIATSIYNKVKGQLTTPTGKEQGGLGSVPEVPKDIQTGTQQTPAIQNQVGFTPVNFSVEQPPVDRPPGRPPINFTPLNPKDPFYNIERMNISPEAKKLIVDEIQRIKPRMEKIVGGVLTDKEVQEAAKTVSDDIVKTIGAEQTKKMSAAMHNLGRKIATMAEEGGLSEGFLESMIRDKSVIKHYATLVQKHGMKIDTISSTAKLKIEVIKNILEVDKDLDKILKAGKNVDWDNPQSVAVFYREFVKPTAEGMVDKLRYSSMLSSLNTHMVNITSTFEGTGIWLPIQKTIEGAVDSFFTAVSMGKRPRERFAGEGLAYIKGYYNIKTLKAARQTFVDIMKGKKEGNYPDIIRDIPLFPKNAPINTKEGILHNVEKIMDGILNALFGEDGFFGTMTKAGLKRAYKYRASKGVKVEDLETRIPKESAFNLFTSDIYDPGEGLISDAIGSLGKGVQAWSNAHNPLARWLVKFNIPFIKIGTNLLKRGLEASPVGVINLIGNKDKTAGIAKIIMGSAVMIWASAQTLQKKMKIYAGLPKDPVKRQAQLDAGIPPWSIEKNGTVIQFSKMNPYIAFQLAIVASVNQAYEEQKITGDTGMAIMDATGKYLGLSIGDASYFKNLGDMSDLMSGKATSLASLISGYISQVVPFKALQGWFTRIIDQYQRAPEKGANLIKKVIQTIQSGIPFASEGVPQRLDFYGQPVENQHRFINAISPQRISTVDQKKAEIFDLYMENAQLNEAIKKQESGDSVTTPGLVSTTAVDQKMTSRKDDLLERKARNEVILYHEPRAINGRYIYWDDEAGAVKTISAVVDKKELESLSPTTQKMKKTDAEYKYMIKLTTSGGIDPTFIKNEAERLGVPLENTAEGRSDVFYDMKTRLTDEFKIEEVKGTLEGLTESDFSSALVNMRRISDGSRESLLSNSVITKLVKEGFIDANTGAYLKTIGWDLKTGKAKIIPGIGKKPKFSKITVPSFKKSSSGGRVRIKIPSFKGVKINSSIYNQVRARMPKAKTAYTPGRVRIRANIRRPVTRISGLGGLN